LTLYNLEKPDCKENITTPPALNLVRLTINSATQEVTVYIDAPMDEVATDKLRNSWETALPAAAKVKVINLSPDEPQPVCEVPPAEVAEFLEVQWSRLVSSLGPALTGLLHFSRPQYDQATSTLTIQVDNSAGKIEMLQERAADDISDLIYRETGRRMTCAFQGTDIFVDAQQQLQADADKEISRVQALERKRLARLREICLWGDEITTPLEPLSGLAERSGKRVTFAGRVSQYKIRHGGKARGRFHTFNLFGVTGAVQVKFFLGYGEILECPPAEGEWVKVRGLLQFAEKADEIVLAATAINRGREPVRQDTCARRRVELHAHTKMSMRDGLTPISRLVERAAHWQHPALAITDHGNVQAFPEAYRAAKKHGVKLILGVEGYLIDDGLPAVFNLQEDRSLAEITWNLLELQLSGNNPLSDSVTGWNLRRMRGDKEIKGWQETAVQADNHDAYLQLQQQLGSDPVAMFSAHQGAVFLRRVLPAGLPNPLIDLSLLVRHLAPGWQQEPGNTVELLPLLLRQAAAQGLQTLRDLNRFYRRVSLQGRDGKKKRVPLYHVIILVRNLTGLRNLYNLVSKSNTKYFYYQPRILRSTLAKYRDGLIIGSACERGEVFQKLHAGEEPSVLRETASFYDYLEVQPVGNNQFMIDQGMVKDQEALRQLNRRIWELGEATERMVVATSDVHFLDPADELFRRVLQVGPPGGGFKDGDRNVPLFYRTTDEMLAEFSWLGEAEAAKVVIDNPVWVADQCEEIAPIPDGFYSPRIDQAAEILHKMVDAGAADFVGEKRHQLIQERVDKEMRSIIDNGFADLYLMASRLVKKSLSDGYIVGSRGSVGSSLVAYLCGITEVNPLPAHYRCRKCKTIEFIDDAACGLDLLPRECRTCGQPELRDGYDIPFEVFVGFKGEKVPDIDLNFSGNYQERAHRFVEEMMGKENVVRAGTVMTLAEKNALGYALRFAERTDRKVSWTEARWLANALIGVKTTNGQHPGGLVILPKNVPIEKFTPRNYPGSQDRVQNREPVETTHFDYHAMESQLVKLDILGHDAPTTLRLLYEYTGVDSLQVPINDPDTLSLFSSHRILKVKKKDVGCGLGIIGIPEFGTEFVRRMLEATRPKTIGELILISGLSHGTDVWKGNADQLIKKGLATLHEVIAVRDNIMLYLIKKGLTPHLAFTIMEKVRKGKGLTADQEEAMVASGVPEWYVESCRKIQYMFPKAHAVAYTLMSLRVAYFKVHHPTAFYAAYFTIKIDQFDTIMCGGGQVCDGKLKELRAAEQLKPVEKKLIVLLEVAREMYARGIRFKAVDLYRSEVEKFIIDDDELLLPLLAINGLGRKAAENLYAARAAGQFQTVRELADRSGINCAQVAALRRHGCLAGIPEQEQRELF